MDTAESPIAVALTERLCDHACLSIFLVRVKTGHPRHASIRTVASTLRAGAPPVAHTRFSRCCVTSHGIVDEERQERMEIGLGAVPYVLEHTVNWLLGRIHTACC